MSTQVQQRGAQAPAALKALLDNPAYKARFTEILKNRAPQFMASIIQVGRSLERCDPHSIISSAMIAATLDLPISKELGFAWMIPYKDQCQFQLGARGYVQLAQRSGQYENINVTEVFEGEVQNIDRLTGRFTLDGVKTGDNVVGYAAYFKLVNGFSKQEYWSLERVKKHAERFSQGYRSGRGSPWQSDFDAMAMKTVLKSLISHWGILSIELQSAVRFDSAVVKEEGGEFSPEFPDNERFEKAKPAKATVVDEPRNVETLPAEQGLPANDPLAGPAEPESKAKPAAVEPTPAPAAAAPAAPAAPAAGFVAQGDPNSVGKLIDLAMEAKISEGQIIAYAQRAYKMNVASVDEMFETSPRRVAMIINSWPTIKAEILGTK